MEQSKIGLCSITGTGPDEGSTPTRKSENLSPINWQFTNEKARIKLKSLYPSL